MTSGAAMNTDVSIVVPVGPEARHRAFLAAALASVAALRPPPAWLVLVDDMAEVTVADVRGPLEGAGIRWSIIRNLWRLGVPASFNVGVASAPTWWSLMLGADDELVPDVLDQWHQTLRQRRLPIENESLVYWGLPVEYMDTGEIQTLPCNAAIVSKGLWRHSGGFAPESAVGACDSMFLSVLLAQRGAAGRVQMVGDGSRGLYRYRRHADTDTAGRAAYQGPIHVVRDVLSGTWRKPEWGRYT
jgi:hypothetical protein